MGRGSGNNSPRNILLGKTGYIRKHELFVESEERDIYTKVFVDEAGNTLVRDHSSRGKPVVYKKDLRANSETNIYIYKDELDYDSLGDSVIAKEVSTAKGYSRTNYFYSDLKTVIKRSSENKYEPVTEVFRDDKISRQIFSWQEGGHWMYRDKIFYDNGKLQQINNLRDGHNHSVGGEAASIDFDRIGKVKKEEWWYDGDISSRDDKPSVIHYYANGRPKERIWYNTEGLLHREGGQPAVIKYDSNGTKVVKKYYINGEIQRRYDK